MWISRIINLFTSDEEWNKTLVARERRLRKELRSLSKAYNPELKKADEQERMDIWAEYTGQRVPLEDELLSVAARRWAIDIPDQLDGSDMNRYFVQTQETRARNAIKRAIRDEKLKSKSLVVSLLSLIVAILALLVGFVSIVSR